jgi:DNA-binding MarR family transcriptional regulator
MSDPAPNDPAIAAVRQFTRSFTRRIGVLRKGLYSSPFSLVEARVLYEIAHNAGTGSVEIARDLGLDPGHLSRIVQALSRRGLVRKRAAKRDARRLSLELTARGRSAFARLDSASQQEVALLLAPLDAGARARLVTALATAERLLDADSAQGSAFTLRSHRIGDMGAIVAAQARLYAREYGWNGEFEALVAEIVAKFVREFDPAREHCWVAERDGEIAGSIFL